ncbi:MAG: serine hydrolase domain-containing protein [Bacteroidota bacterium]
MNYQRLVRRLLGIHVLLFLFSASLFGQSTVGASVDRFADKIAKARSAILDSMARSGVPGASIAISLNDTLIWSEGFGYADVEQRVLVTPSTKFRIGSVSKPLTASALAQLVEQGKIDLDAPIQKYVPNFPKKRWPITARELAGHLAGIRHYRNAEFLLQRHFETVQEGLTVFQDDTLLFEPGTKFSYSSYGWNLLSAAIEGASGEPFLTYMDRHILGPLTMHNTTAEYVDSILAFRAHFYSLGKDRALVNAPFVDNSYKWAGGGFLSTPEDLILYARMWLDPGFLKPDTKRLFMTSQRTVSGEVTRYGLGWFETTDRKGRHIVSHDGGSVGGTSSLLLYPERKFIVAIICNSDVSFVRVSSTMFDTFLE